MNNFLFTTYAQVVEKLFGPQQRSGGKVSFFPSAEKQSLPTDPQPTAAPGLHLSEMIHPGGLQATQDLVDHLRGAWGVVRRDTDKATPASAPMSAGESERVRARFSEFQTAVQDGDEKGLVANPFYELTKLVFQQNLNGAKNLFVAIHANLMRSPPEPVPLLRPFREIWFDNSAPAIHGIHKKKTGIFRKIADQLDAVMGMGKVIVAILLFFGSTFTTAQGINDLLQSQEASELFGGMFDGRESEVLRYGIAILVGLLLSALILDYKDRLFSSIAEEGGVLRGIRNAVLRHPRWMILATLLTVFSIKTNYDGIVSLISKKADLAKQSEQIRYRVKKALGSPFFVNTVEPDDLHDVRGLLQQATDDSVTKFNRVPDDEVSGVASSGDPRMGPRYWGKYFIVNGGYEPGVRDVAHSTQSLTAGFSARIDDMLRSSGLDLRVSAADKIKSLRKRYDDHLQRAESLVEERLDNLRGLMEMRGYSLEEIKRVFALEHYQINEIVLSMANVLEENKNEYERVAAELNRLTDAYVAVLQQVDKSGAAAKREYNIEGKLAIPDLDAIKELKNTHIPKAKHKSFAELKEFLAGEYGVAMANGLLLTILFLSFCMDLLDPLIYSRWTAIIGRQDKSMFPDLMGYLREWENDFIVGCHQYFYRRDVQQVFSGLSLPNRTGIRNAFYLLLEEMDPLLKDPRDQTLFQRLGDWFKGLFRLTRTHEMRGYNRRAAALGRFVAGREHYFQQLLEYMLPGIRFEQATAREPFALVIKKTEVGQEQQREIFAWELQAVSGQVTLESAEGAQGQVDALNTRVALEQKRRSISRLRGGGEQAASPAQREKEKEEAAATALAAIPPRLLKARLRPEGAVNPLLRLFFQQGSRGHRLWCRFWDTAFMGELAPFAHTRRRWLQEIARQDGRTLEDMEGLYDFMPDLKETLLVTLPGIRRDVVGTVEEIRRRFPTHCLASGLITAEELDRRVEELEKEALQVLGLSPAMGDLTRLYSPVGGIALELEGVSRAVLDHVGGDPTGFQEKVAELTRQAADALARSTGIERAVVQEMTDILKDVKRLHESIKQILLKINMSSTTSRKSSLPLRDMLRLLRQNKDMLEQAPRQSESILKAVEQIFNEKTAEGESLPCTEASLEVLKKMRNEERNLFEGLMRILVEVQGAESSASLEQELPEGVAVDMKSITLPPLQDDGEGRLADAVSLATPTRPTDGHVTGDRVPESKPVDPFAGTERPEQGTLAASHALREEEREEQPSPSSAEADDDAGDLVVPTLLLYDTHANVLPQAELLEEEEVAVSPLEEPEGVAESVGTPSGENGLIVVAEFAQWQPGETAGATREMVRATPVARGLRKPPKHWELGEIPPEDDFFASGLLPALPLPAAGGVAREIAKPLRVAEPVSRQPAAQQNPPAPRTLVKPAQAPVARAPALAGGRPSASSTALEFKTRSGINFRGVAKDVSLNGCYADDMDLAGVKAQDTGRLRLVSDVGVHQFPCEVVEVAESAHETSITLRLFANGHQFESVTKEKIFKEVWRDHQALQHGQPAADSQPPFSWKN
ncbi:MAG: hypothetical protein H7836_14555 [Magnetococcus sp. YQC-3]